MFRGEVVEDGVERGMHGDQLALQVRRQFADDHAGSRTGGDEFVAVILTLGCSLKVDELRAEGRYLDRLVALGGGPSRDLG